MTATTTDLDLAVALAEVVLLPERMRDDMVAHAVRVAPNECVGVLAAGIEDTHRVAYGCESALPLLGLAEYRNHSPEPRTNFFVEPHAQYEIEARFAQRAWDTVAVYHSHPRSAAEPSAADLAVANGRLMVIVGLTDPENPDVRCWRVVNGAPEPVRMEVTDG